MTITNEALEAYAALTATEQDWDFYSSMFKNVYGSNPGESAYYRFFAQSDAEREAQVADMLDYNNFIMEEEQQEATAEAEAIAAAFAPHPSTTLEGAFADAFAA